MKFLAIDFETANYSRNSACSIGLVRVEAGVITQTQMHLIRPPTSEFVFTHVHGLSWTDVKSAKTFAEIWPEIQPMFEGVDFLVAHNAPFDKSVLAKSLEHYGKPAPSTQFRCSLKESKQRLSLPAYKLSDVCRHLGIQLNHHEALSDALACAKIMIHFAKA